MYMYICDPPYNFRDKGDNKLTIRQHNILRVSKMCIYYLQTMKDTLSFVLVTLAHLVFVLVKHDQSHT